MKKWFLGLVCALGFIHTADAYEVKSVCAKYQTNYSWSKSYKVKAQFYRGDELNREIGSFSRFNMFDYYAVIWWDREQASIIKMDSPYLAGVMMFNSSGVDQNGRQWSLSDGDYSMCW